MKTFSVLLVDDNRSFAKRLLCMLEEVNTGCSGDYADNAGQALRLVQENRYDLILLDIQMPGKTGIELLKELKRIRWQGTTIIVSNLVNDYYRRECEKWGALAFFDKTKELDKVLTAVMQMRHHTRIDRCTPACEKN